MSAEMSRPPSREAQIAEVLASLLNLMRTDQPGTEVQPKAVATSRTLLTVAEAAEQLGIGRTTAYGLIKSGQLESVLIGRLRRVHADAVGDYAARLVAQSNRSAA